MKRLVGFGKAFRADVGVYLSGANIGVSQHFLHGAQVCAVVEQVGGEGMAQGVGGNILPDVGASRMTFHHAPYRTAAEPFPRGTDEHSVIPLCPVHAQGQPCL